VRRWWRKGAQPRETLNRSPHPGHRAGAVVRRRAWKAYVRQRAGIGGCGSRRSCITSRRSYLWRVYIPKADGRQRPLGIASIEDKIVQQAVVTVLSAIYDEDFLGFSYGFRPGRGQHNALDALTVGIKSRKVNWIVDADIRSFLDTALVGPAANLPRGAIGKIKDHRVRKESGFERPNALFKSHRSQQFYRGLFLKGIGPGVPGTSTGWGSCAEMSVELCKGHSGTPAFHLRSSLKCVRSGQFLTCRFSAFSQGFVGTERRPQFVCG
jgi:hypothetical protein